MLGFLCRAKPPTGVISAGFPTVKALGEKSHQKEIRVRLHPEESLVDGDETGDVQHPRRIKVLQLQTPLIEEPA